MGRVLSLLALVGCGPDGLGGAPGWTSLGAAETGDAPAGDASTDDETLPDPDPGSTTDPGDGSAPGVTSFDPEGSSGDAIPTPQDCSFTAADFGAGLLELDVPAGSTEVLSFDVAGLPDPSMVTSATLHFDSYDADHPGEEGVITVNGAGAYDLPANVAWDNAGGDGSVEISGTTIEGVNTIHFGAGPLSRSFYRIGNVRIDLTATVAACPEPPPPAGVERTVQYTDATYAQRNNWVVRCDGFAYAYTASSDEHIPSDCDGLYAPDGSRTGTATFAFPDLVDATYEVAVHSRHTANRNPAGALIVVDGVGKRIFQNDAADFTTDIWGQADLGGDVDVVLDSTMENASDSIVWVRLTPVP